MSPTREVRLTVRRIATPTDLEKAFEIRRHVFLIEQQVPPEEEFDEDDKTALHVLAFAGTEAVGTGRLVFRPGYARVGRMAVLADRRSQGVGRAILEELLRAAAENNVRRVILHAQVHAIGFYQTFGFQPLGDVFEEAGISHRVMERLF